MNTLRPLLLAAFLVFSLPVSARAATEGEAIEPAVLDQGLTQACSLMRNALQSADALSKDFETQAALFSPADRATITQRIGTELGDHRMKRAGIYDLGGIDGFLREYLVALASGNKLNVYVVARYETLNEREMKLTNFRYFDNFSRIEQQDFMQAPQAIDCPPA